MSITTPQGKQIAQLDGGGGHGGFRSFDVRFGLDSYTGPVKAHFTWRDSGGGLHTKTQQLSAGSHTLMLTDDIQEVTSR